MVTILGEMADCSMSTFLINGTKQSRVRIGKATATVSGGVAVFNFVDPDTNTAFFPNGGAIYPTAQEPSQSLLYSNYVWSNSNKTLTIDVNKLGTVVLGIIQFIAAANGTSVTVFVMGV